MPVIFGFHPVRETLRSRPREVARVLVAAHRGGARLRDIEELCARHGIPVERVGDGRLAAVAPGNHQGFAAEVREVQAPRPTAGADPDFVVLVEDVQDPRNLGALLRVCEGAGVGRVLLRNRGSAPLTPTVVRTSVGAAEWLPVERIPNTAAALQRLKGEGFWVYGAAAGGDPPWEADLKGKVVLCLGGEEKGLRRLTRERCDRLLGLPMRGSVQSLNLATAAAALLYEAVRQRGGG